MPREVWDVGKVRQESQRERDIATQTRVDQQVQAREKSGRVARYLDDDIRQADESISIAEDSESPYVSMPAAGPMSYLQPSLTPTQGQALTSLGDFSVLEAGGALINVEDAVTRVARIIEEKTKGAGGTYAWWKDQITLPTRTMTGANLDQVTKHELLHRLTQQLEKMGILEKIPLPEMQAIIEKFDPQFQGKVTVQDFINFVQMNNPRNLRQNTATGMVPSTATTGWYSSAEERFDPRMRTAGWQENMFGTAPWAGSSERGQQLYEDYMDFQRELPSEKYGGGVVGYKLRTGTAEEPNYIEGIAPGTWLFPGDPGYNQLIGTVDPSDPESAAKVGKYGKRAIPWGPSTVNYRYERDDQDEWVKTPVSTGTPMTTYAEVPSKHPSGQTGQVLKDEWGNDITYTDGAREDLTTTDVYSQVGLGNWPMGSEHALLAAQAARFDLPGQEGYMGEPAGGQYYGELSRFNRAAALKSHPDSRIRAIAEAGIPNIVLEKLTEVLSTGGDEVWGQFGSWENAKKYLDQLMKQYQAGMAPQ